MWGPFFFLLFLYFSKCLYWGWMVKRFSATRDAKNLCLHPGVPWRQPFFFLQAKLSHSCLHHLQAPLSPFLLSPDLPMSRPIPSWKSLHAWPASCFNFLALFFSNFSNTRPPWVFVSNLPTLLSVYATCFFQDRITLSKACPSTVNAVDHFLLLGTFSSQFPWYYILLCPLCPWPLLLAPSQAHFLLPSWLSLKVEISQRGWMSLEN